MLFRSWGICALRPKYEVSVLLELRTPWRPGKGARRMIQEDQHTEVIFLRVSQVIKERIRWEAFQRRTTYSALCSRILASWIAAQDREENDSDSS